jgi:sec-independent protein translocase protein TatB
LHSQPSDEIKQGHGRDNKDRWNTARTIMFGMSGTELVIIFVLALLLLGPHKLPDLARSLGRALRDFRRATEDVRSSVESEFYRMDQPPPPSNPPPVAAKPEPTSLPEQGATGAEKKP